MSKIAELTGKLEERRQTLSKVFEEAGEDYDFSKVTAVEGSDSAAKAAAVKQLNDEMTDLAKQIEEIDGLGSIKDAVDGLGEVRRPGTATRGEEKTRKSLGQLALEGGALVKGGKTVDLGSYGLKVTFSTETGIDPWEEQSTIVERARVRELSILDIIPKAPTTSDLIVYRQQNTFVNSAAAVGEGDAKPEGGLSWTRAEEPVRKIAVWIPVTDEELADVPGARSLVDEDLTQMVREELENEVVDGSGSDPELKGILQRTSEGVQTQAKGADPTPDAFYKAMTKIRVNGKARPNAHVLHPNDWQDIRLLRTSDGIYIWGNPADAGPERMWGLQVVLAEGITEGTGLVGDFNRAKLRVREELNVRVGYIDDQFIRNTQSILAELRAALMVIRPSAFCKVTGI